MMTNPPDETSNRRNAESRNAMVATGHPRAAEAALDALRRGGTAVDAAIAADAVLGVVEPMATGVGGDVMAMLVEPSGAASCYNGSGRSPVNLPVGEVDAFEGGRIPERHVHSVTTPGAVRGWSDLHRRHGRLEWRTLFDHAIRAAADGFRVGRVAAREWRLFDHVLRGNAACAELYRAGNPPAEGEIFRNPQLGDTLQLIAEKGADGFYLGEPATAAGRAVQRAGGALAAVDFEMHRGEFGTPLRGRFREVTVLECPPNTHGVSVLRALGAIDRLLLSPQSAADMVAAVEAMGRGLDEARKTVSDPAGNTVCTVVVDADGFAVTLMSSIFKRFGSGIAVPRCGFVLQNRGHGFSAPGKLNGAAPGRRPYHTVIPAATIAGGRMQSAFGVVGGAMQPQGHVQLLMRLHGWGEEPAQALAAPRWRLEAGGSLAIEPGMPAHIERALRRAGYPEPKGTGELGGRSDFGGAQMVVRSRSGTLAGSSDPRKDGIAAGL
jgi:gamma-glutamyltranspeptidase/glutathione hydrolase